MSEPTSDWHEEGDNAWLVRFPADPLPEQTSGQGREPDAPRWAGTLSVDTSEVQKRLAWLLLAAEIGMALVAACVLPLVFLNLPVRQEGFIGAIGTKVGGWLGLSSQMACLVMVLPIPILMVTLGANLWWFRRMRRRARQTDDRESTQPQG